MTRREDQELEDYQEDTPPFRYPVTSYGADFDVEGLVRRIARGDIFVPSFQRGFVWKQEDSSKFIESLLLGLPVPAIFLAQENDTQKLLVIDGQQRLYSLYYFYQGQLSLRGISRAYNGLIYENLKPEDQRRLDNSLIHAVIVRQDHRDDSLSSIYFIFERLNIGRTKLQAQELRSALYHDKFNDLLQTLNQNEKWRILYGAPSDRLRDEELILRFIALFYEREKYRKPMLEFLNRFMGRNRDLDVHRGEDIHSIFNKTVDIIHDCIGKDAFRPRKSLNTAMAESVMLGIAERVSAGLDIECKDVKHRYKQLLDNEEFLALTRTSTTDESKMFYRLATAIQTFTNA